MTDAELTELKQAFDRDGYCVLRKFFSPEEVRQITNEVTTAKSRLGDSTLDRSGLQFREYLYHFSPHLQQMIGSARVVEVMSRIIGPDLWVRRDTAIIKKPGGEEFPWHQDNGYNQLLDGYVQFWIACNGMNNDNGGVWLIPGSHKMGLRPHHMQGSHAVFSEPIPKGALCAEADPGDVLVFSSYILHRTGPNRTQKDRIAYLVEFMDRKYFDPYTKPPFFLVSKNGKPEPVIRRYYEGNMNVLNHLKYIGPRLYRRFMMLRGQIKRMVVESIHIKSE